MQRFRPYVLPTAIVLGLLLHDWCAMLSRIIPVLIFTILLLSFSAVEIKKLRPGWFDAGIVAFQVVVGVGMYVGLSMMGVDKIIAEGVMLGALCPVAASSTVVSVMLGADRVRVTTYAIVGNLAIAVVAPVVFTIIGEHPEQSLWQAYMLIFAKIGSILAVPFFVALGLQAWLPRVNEALACRTNWSYYIWAVALLLTIGQTIDYIFRSGDGHWGSIAWLGGLSLVGCAIQFILGRKYGKVFEDPIGGAQMMAQKNSAMGIWMATTFLNPLSSVFMAFYSVWQNLYNAYQISRIKK